MKVGDLVRLKRYISTDVYGVVVEVKYNISMAEAFLLVQTSKGERRMERQSWLEVINENR